MQLFVLQIVLQMGLFACNFLCSKSCSRWVFSRATFCAPNRAPDGSFRVQLFVVQIVLQIGFFACSFLCSMPFFTTGRVTYAHFARGSSTLFQNRVFFRECFCAINHVFFFRFNCKDARRKRKKAPLKCLELVQNQLCNGPSTLQKPQPIQVSLPLPCSRWVLSRAIFCGPDRALDQPFFVQLFVLRIVLQMGLFACSFLWSRSCSRWVFLRAAFCGPDRAPNRSFRVQLFVLQIALQMGVFACNF